ncbi:MAG TPA: GlsB/YeaQ/YmgE family stress response membrane protein [Actinocrinis sp.]
MGILAWIVLGVIAGAVAEHLVSRRGSHGIIVTCLIGVVGALAGGWVASRLFHVHSLQGFFNLSTWITALVGATVLLGAVRLVEGRSGGRKSLRR